jgi:hypothetical protein
MSLLKVRDICGILNAVSMLGEAVSQYCDRPIFVRCKEAPNSQLYSLSIDVAVWDLRLTCTLKR